MPDHIDILAEQESLRKPVFGSVCLHITVFVLLALQGMIGRKAGEQWGNPDSLGGSAVGITAVSQIPLPSRGGLPNPLANDTESQVPAPPKPEARRAPELDPDAIPLRSRKNAKPEPRSRRKGAEWQSARTDVRDDRGQIYSESGRALASALVGRTGSGGVGIGTGGAFGTRFGAYRDLLEQKIAQRWRTDDVDSRIQSAPPAIVTFLIYRNGSTADVRIEQSSGNRALDNSALRAVYEASPFPQLPMGYERNDARIEVQFQLRR